MVRFADFVRRRLKEDAAPGEPPVADREPDSDADMSNLQRFLFLALQQSESSHQLLPLFHQIASADKTGEMADLLHNIDWSGLKERSKKLLKKLDGKVSPGDDDGPVKQDRPHQDRIDQYKPSFADSGQSMDGGQP